MDCFAGCPALAIGFGLELRSGFFGQPLGELLDDFLVSWTLRKVVKFIRVSLVIIQLLGAVFIGDESPIA